MAKADPERRESLKGGSHHGWQPFPTIVTSVIALCAIFVAAAVYLKPGVEQSGRESGQGQSDKHKQQGSTENTGETPGGGIVDTPPPFVLPASEPLRWHAPRLQSGDFRRVGHWYEAPAPLGTVEIMYTGNFAPHQFRVRLVGANGYEHVLQPSYYSHSMNNNSTGRVELQFARYRRAEAGLGFLGTFRLLLETQDPIGQLWRVHEIPVREVLASHESPGTWWVPISAYSDTFSLDGPGMIVAKGRPGIRSSAFIRDPYRFRVGLTIEGEVSAKRPVGSVDPWEIAFGIVLAERVNFEKRTSYGREVQFILGDGASKQHSIRESSDNHTRPGTFTSQELHRAGERTRFKAELIQAGQDVFARLYINEMATPVLMQSLGVEWMIDAPVFIGLRIYNSGTVSISEYRVHELHP